MAIVPIIKKEDYILRQISVETNEIETVLLQDMYDTLKSTTGIGIAAPQIGILKRVIIVDYQKEVYKIINPRIIHKEGKQIYLEGCLSIDTPGDYQYGKVERAYKITVEGIDENGNGQEITVEGIPAVIFQHEIDHLDGILYTDKIIGKLLHFKTIEERRKYKEEKFQHEIICKK